MGSGPFPANSLSSGLCEEQDSCGEGTEKHEDKDNNDEDKVGWEEGGSEEPEEPNEDAAPLPYQSAAEFGFTTEATAQFIGFLCVADVELFLPVLQLNIAGTNQKVVAGFFSMCI